LVVSDRAAWEASSTALCPRASRPPRSSTGEDTLGATLPLPGRGAPCPTATWERCPRCWAAPRRVTDVQSTRVRPFRQSADLVLRGGAPRLGRQQPRSVGGLEHRLGPMRLAPAKAATGGGHARGHAADAGPQELLARWRLGELPPANQLREPSGLGPIGPRRQPHWKLREHRGPDGLPKVRPPRPPRPSNDLPPES